MMPSLNDQAVTRLDPFGPMSVMATLAGSGLAVVKVPVIDIAVVYGAPTLL